MAARKTGSSDGRSVQIGGDAVGNVIQTGDRNTATLTHVTLPAPESVDIHQELRALRSLLEALATPDSRKLGNALSDAEDELAKPEPDREEVGRALDRALEYASRAEGFANAASALKPHVVAATAWLGSNWHGLLQSVGVAL